MQAETGKAGNWWSRNWKWFVPVGCLTLIAGTLLFGVMLVMMIFGLIKSSDAYQLAMEQVREHPQVQTAIGIPIEEGTFFAGNINVNGDSGNANLSIPISGPVSAGTVHVNATKSAGTWTFHTLLVDVEASDERIDLLSGTGPTD